MDVKKWRTRQNYGAKDFYQKSITSIDYNIGKRN
jgi:hypothetical protein